MPKYVIEREVPEAGKLSADQAGHRSDDGGELTIRVERARLERAFSESPGELVGGNGSSVRGGFRDGKSKIILHPV